MNLSWIKSEEHKKLIERWWIAIVLVWGVIRAFLVDKTFAKYGVNPWVYLAIDMLIAVPYAISTSKFVFALIEKHFKNSMKWGASAILFHYIPDSYILATARSVPRTLFDGFLFAVAVFTLLGAREVVIKMKTGKAK